MRCASLRTCGRMAVEKAKALCRSRSLREIHAHRRLCRSCTVMGAERVRYAQRVGADVIRLIEIQRSGWAQMSTFASCCCSMPSVMNALIPVCISGTSSDSEKINPVTAPAMHARSTSTQMSNWCLRGGPTLYSRGRHISTDDYCEWRQPSHSSCVQVEAKWFKRRRPSNTAG